MNKKILLCLAVIPLIITSIALTRVALGPACSVYEELKRRGPEWWDFTGLAHKGTVEVARIACEIEKGGKKAASAVVQEVAKDPVIEVLSEFAQGRVSEKLGFKGVLSDKLIAGKNAIKMLSGLAKSLPKQIEASYAELQKNKGFVIAMQKELVVAKKTVNDILARVKNDQRIVQSLRASLVTGLLSLQKALDVIDSILERLLVAIIALLAQDKTLTLEKSAIRMEQTLNKQAYFGQSLYNVADFLGNFGEQLKKRNL